MVKAAIYARISSDDGTALGVGRQLDDCRKLAADLGWAVGEEYVDNDVSAHAKRRPAYERMLADLRDGLCDGVLVYHVDRLTRRPIELEQFIEVVTAAGVSHVQFVSGGGLDAGSGDGLLMVRMLSAVAANESATKSRRVKRKMEQVAASGLPHGGVRPFGYEADRMTVRPDEAAVIVAVVARFLAGESLRSLAVWMTDQEIPTVRGAAVWQTTTLRNFIKSPRIAGLREHRGEIVGTAAWPAIISVEDHRRVLARIAELASSSRRSPRRYLLSGMLRCHKCEGRLFSSARTNSRRYVCMSGPDHGGCGGTYVTAPPVEELIADAVLYRLDSPEMAETLTGRAADTSEASALADTLAADRAQLDELAGLYASRQIGAREWMTARRPIEDRISDTERRLARLTRSETIAGLAGQGAELRRQWSTLNLTRQAAIVAAVLDHAVIGPGDPAARSFDPARVTPVWRL